MVFGVNETESHAHRLIRQCCWWVLLDNTPYNNNAGTSADRGIALSNSGWLAVARDGQPTAYFNRTQSDGTIVEFRKDGSTVGSIGTTAGDIQIGSGDTALRFQASTDSVFPAQASGGGRGSAIDLGLPTVPFKDLYLSNSAYVKNIGGISDTDTYLNFGDVANTIKAFTGNTERMRIDRLIRTSWNWNDFA